MATKQSLEAGRGHVTLWVDDGAMIAGLRKASANFSAWGNNLAAAGASMLKVGLTMVAALTPGVMAFAKYEQSLADLQAAAKATPEQMDRVKASIEALSKATGQDPNEVADGFRQLLFAGVELDKVIAGAGETLVKFARVGLMPAGEAALVLTDAVNVFARDAGMSFGRAADIITQGASASSISIKDVADSFAQSGSAMAQFNQNMLDTAVAIGIMGNAGVKGAQAGTALKTVMTRLATGMGEGGEAADEVSRSMQAIGLNVYDAAGKMLPIVEIIRRINVGLEGKTDQEKNQIIKGIAGMRGMIGLLPLLRSGVTGFNEFSASMTGSLTVEQRFAIMNDTLLASLKKVWVHLQFVAIEIGAALAPALRTIGAVLLPLLNGMQAFVSQNKELVQAFAFDAIKAIAFGGTLIALGKIISGVGLVFSILAGALAAIGSVVVFAGIATALYLLLQLVPEVSASITGFLGTAFRELTGLVGSATAAIKENFAGVVELLNAGEITAAFGIVKAGMEISWLQFKDFFLRVWDEIVTSVLSRWHAIGDAILQTAADAFGVSTGMSPAQLAQQRELAAQAAARTIQGLTMAEAEAARDEARQALIAMGPLGGPGQQTYSERLESAEGRQTYDQALQDAINRRFLEQNPNARQIRVVNGRVVDGPAVNVGGGMNDFVAPETPEQRQRRIEIERLQAAQRTRQETALEALEYENYLNATFNWPTAGPGGRPPSPNDGAGGPGHLSALGSFNAQAIFGMIGAGQSPVERQTALLAAQVEENRRHTELLRQLIAVAQVRFA